MFDCIGGSGILKVESSDGCQSHRLLKLRKRTHPMPDNPDIAFLDDDESEDESDTGGNAPDEDTLIILGEREP